MTTADTERGSRLREQIRQALNSQRQPTITVLSSLLAVQDSIHYLPDEAINETATFCGSTINEVWSVASFYTNFKFTTPGEKTLDVCWGPACHVLGAQSILNSVHGALELAEEGESQDGKVSLKYNTCLGACAQGPCIAIDHHLIGKQTPESAAAIARDLRGLEG
ncbi:MAG: NAD(P)H-dependent oxidoreductase subunit E [Dehalococcoidia bacterium]|nr:NAD(P)H-dependent oxidoreductase subunit E [Dehalococcoidia bacterium]